MLETVFDELISCFRQRSSIGADEVPLGAWSAALAWRAARDFRRGAGSTRQAPNVMTNQHGATRSTDRERRAAAFRKRVRRLARAAASPAAGARTAMSSTRRNVSVRLAHGRGSAALAGGLPWSFFQPGPLPRHGGPGMVEPGAGWAGWSDPEKLYRFDAVEGWTDQQKRRFLGVQSCIWSEPMTDRAVFDRLVFPRLSALAETGWTRPEHKSWERFKALAGLMPILYGFVSDA